MAKQLQQVRKLYPQKFLFSVLIGLMDIASKRILTIKKDEPISEFRYVMD